MLKFQKRNFSSIFDSMALEYSGIDNSNMYRVLGFRFKRLGLPRLELQVDHTLNMAEKVSEPQ